MLLYKQTQVTVVSLFVWYVNVNNENSNTNIIDHTYICRQQEH